MEHLNNIETAVIEVKKALPEKRIEVIGKYLNETIPEQDLSKKSAKELLHRRALFVSELSRLKLWPDE